MGLFEDTNPRKLRELLVQIHEGEAALPDFQRDFVWDPGATQELIVSIASDYPAGSLLRIRNTRKLLAYREFQGAPRLKGTPTYLVLDGQQRLTSLYQAFYAVGEHRYYLKVDGLVDGKEFEDCIFHLRSNTKLAQEYERPEVQARDLVLPLGMLAEDTGNFWEWRNMVLEHIEDRERRARLETALRKVYRRWIQTIHDYQFPVVTLSDSTSADAVCTIFETLNRTGVKLTAFELLTARFWPQDVNLRQLWAKVQAEHSIIADFQIDPYYLLQVVALVSRQTPSATRGDVLALESSTITEWWDRVAWGMAEALKILRDDCGVITPGWLPYSTIVNPMAAVMAKMAVKSSPTVGAHRHKLVRWFWCSVFGQAYESSLNSQIAKDVGELLAWLDGGDLPTTVREFRFDPRTLRDTTPRQRAIYRGVICLVMTRSPKDFHSGEKLTSNLIVEHRVDDHHIFPQAYLESKSVDVRLRECVLNRTLIDRTTNILIGKRPPSNYMSEIRTALGDQKFNELLQSHLLPAGPNSPLWLDDFERFLSWRQEMIWREIRDVTGVQEPSDLLVEEASA